MCTAYAESCETSERIGLAIFLLHVNDKKAEAQIQMAWLIPGR